MDGSRLGAANLIKKKGGEMNVNEFILIHVNSTLNWLVCIVNWSVVDLQEGGFGLRVRLTLHNLIPDIYILLKAICFQPSAWLHLRLLEAKEVVTGQWAAPSRHT